MEITHRVRDCPRSESEWQKASDRLNCTSGALSTENKYHCFPAKDLTTLHEFCYTRIRLNVVKGTHTITSAYGSIDSEVISVLLKTLFNYLLNVLNMEKFKLPWPSKAYLNNKNSLIGDIQ